MPPLSRMGWSPDWGIRNEGYDIHVIRNKASHALIDDVAFIEVIDEFHWKWYARNEPKVTAEIKPGSIAFFASFRPSALGDPSNFGIKIEPGTGVITAGAPSGGATIHNFLLWVQATRASDNATLSTPVMRVHVHDRVRQCWLTPQMLSVYRGSPNQQFTVLAEFESDGQPDPPLVGDVSRLPGITWTVVPVAGSTTKRTDITLGATGEIKTTSATALGPLAVAAQLPASFGSKQATGAGEVVLGFDEQPQSHYQAMLRSGPGTARLADVPNILLLAEGFQVDQESDWDTLIANLVTDLSLSAAFRPFDRFISEGSVNVWSLFLPSRDRGSSVLHELRIDPPTPPATQPSGLGIPRTRSNPKVLDLNQAFYEFGLPVRSDTPLGTDDAQKIAKVKDAQKIAKVKEWNLIRNRDLDPNEKVVSDLWQEWAGWAGRTLADERDTLLGLAIGTRPNVASDSVDRGAQYHPFRAQRAELNKLLAKITDGDGPLIGHVWVPKSTDSSRDEAGKDISLVVALIGGGRSGGIEAARSVTSASIHRQGTIPLKPVGNPSTTLRVQVLPHDIPTTRWGEPQIATLQIGTIIHELGHAFGLGDEYVEPSFVIAIPTGHSNRGLPNLMPESELVDSTSAVGVNVKLVGDKLVGDKLRWRWPRISTAAVLSSAPWFSTSSHNSEIVIPLLRKGDKLKFKNGDVVFLRRRPLRGVVDTTHVVAEPSKPLIVTGDLQVEEQIVVRTQDGTDLDITQFPVFDRLGPLKVRGFDPIIFIAVPPPPYAAVHDKGFAELTPLVVRDYITTTGLPLNRKTAATCGDLDDTKRAALVNVPDVFTFPWKRRWVGAFDGGGQYPCGIYHPSPDCMMRAVTNTVTFCPVCRYILVDAVDPSLHGEIDAEYARGYVQPV